MRHILRSVALVCMCFSLASGARAADLFQDFEDWDNTYPGTQWYTNHDGWAVIQAYVRDIGTAQRPGSTNSVWLYNTGTSYVRSPLLSAGAGDLRFWARNRNSDAIDFAVYTATNLSDWGEAVTNLVSTNLLGWTYFDLDLNSYDPVYVILARTAEQANGIFLSFDEIETTDPPTRVDFVSLTTDPDTPEINDPVTVSTIVNPSTLATNIQATLYYRTEGTGDYTPIGMVTNTSPTTFVATNDIPGQDAGILVEYYVTVSFEGPYNLSPTNEPATAPATPASYTVQTRPFLGNYKTMTVIGDAEGELRQYSDYAWQGVLATTGTLSNADVRFQGVASDFSSTNTWGDSDQPDTDLPITDTADTSLTDIRIDSMEADSQFVFQFNESNLTYTIQQCLYQDFDSWFGAASYGDHSLDNWFAHDAAIDQDDTRKHVFRAAFLQASNAYVRTPQLPQGIGEITFWYRNYEQTGSPATSLAVQKSLTGGTNESEWIDIGTVPVIGGTNYVYKSIRFNDRAYPYARIRNTGPAGLCVDEITVAYPGAGVAFTNLANTPQSPSAFEPVTVNVQITPLAGATNLAATLYYRPAGTGAYTPIGMLSTNGSVYTTTNEIPAGIGQDGDGIGDVEYYVACTFDGFNADLGRPQYEPADTNAPASYSILAASIAFSNVVINPSDPTTDDAVDVEADIFAYDGASNIVATLKWRVGESGGFSTQSMSEVSTDHFVTDTPIPAQPAPGTRVEYRIEALFEGPQNSPTNYPGGLDTLFYTVAAAQADSSYTNLLVTGTFSESLNLIADYQWQGVDEPGTFTNGQFRFEAQNGGTTLWGDTDPLSGTLPVYGQAAAGTATTIPVNGTNTGYFVFEFNETNGAYSAQNGEYADFEGWLTGSGVYTNDDGWVIEDGETGDTVSLALRGRYLQLAADSGSARIISPHLDRGLGYVSFWYRNRETGGLDPTSFSVQVAPTNSGPWTTLDVVSNIISESYLYYRSEQRSDRVNRYVRIVNATNTGARLCLDDIIVSDAPAGVAFANVTNSPANPTILQNVHIYADITPQAGAGVADVTAWYRAGTNSATPFDASAMTNLSGTLYRTMDPLPRGEIGTMQYYLEAAYTGYRAEDTSPAYYPAAGSEDPVSYESTDLAADIQDFEDWDNTYAGLQSYTNHDGWAVIQTYVRDIGGVQRPGSTKSAWLYNTGTSYVRSPLLPGGAGLLSFWARNRNSDAIDFAVYVTTNLSDWGEAMTNLVCTNQYDWDYFELLLNTYEPVYIILERTAEQGNGIFLTLDDIGITYPSARIQFDSTMIHPGYPGAGETIDISTRITSYDTNTPAFNILGNVYYRSLGETTYSGPVAMGRDGDYFRTLDGIPGQAGGDVIEYYIEASFSGYHPEGANMSPMSHPAAGGSDPFSFDVRRRQSSFERVETETSYGDISDMVLVDDNTWAGVLNVRQPTNQITFTFEGFGQYTNDADEYAAGSIHWGLETEQTRFVLPLTGGTLTDGTNIVINISTQFLGDIIFQFNSADGTYLIRGGSYQDFNSWLASEQYYEESLGSSDIAVFTNLYDDWPLNQTYTAQPYDGFENFEGFITVTNYQSQSLISSNGWYVEDAEIIRERGDLEAGALDPDGGRTWVDPAFVTDGLGTFEFEYRCRLLDQAHTWYIPGTNFNNYRIDAAFHITAIDPEWPYVSLFARYDDTGAPDYYELRLQQGEDGNLELKLYRSDSTNTLSGGSTTIPNTSLEGFHDLTFMVVTNNTSANDTIYLEGRLGEDYTVSAFDNGSTRLNRAGTVGVFGRGADFGVEDLAVKHNNIQNFGYWADATWGTHSNMLWTVYRAQLTGTDQYTELARQISSAASQTFGTWSGATTYGDWSSSDNWELHDGKVVSGRGYLGSSAGAYLMSPLLTNGVSALTFLTRNVSTNSIEFLVRTFDGSWSTFATRTSTLTASDHSWTFKIEDPSVTRIQIYKNDATLPDHALQLDNVYIYEKPPAAYVESPVLDYTIGRVEFDYRRGNGNYVVSTDNRSVIVVQGRASGSTNWIDVSDRKSTALTSFTGYDSQTEADDFSSYEQVRIASLGTNYHVIIDDIYITEATAFYTNTFTTESEVANWEEPQGHWFIEGGEYKRRGYIGPELTIYVDIGPTNWTGSVEPPAWSNILSFTTSNLTYATTSLVIEAWDETHVQVRHVSPGSASAVIDDCSMTSWRGTRVFETNGWKGTEIWVQRDGTDSDRYVELWRSRANPANDQAVRSLYMTNGVGIFSFEYKTENGPCTFLLQQSNPLSPDVFDNTLATNTVDTDSWLTFSRTLNNSTSMYLRVVHVSTNLDAVLLVNNMKLKDYAERDVTTWVAYNALITYTDDQRDFEPYIEPETAVRTCYLNNNPSDGPIPGVTYDAYLPYIQTPRLPSGLGAISFWHRNWETNGTPPTSLQMVWAGSVEALDATNGTVLGMLSFTNTQYEYFSTNVYLPEARYLRIYSTNTADFARICLDNILVAEPVAADVDLAGLVTLPNIPLYTNAVNFQVTLQNFFLSPSNFECRLYYHIGTNDWGDIENWNSGNWMPFNKLVASNTSSRTLETTAGIPMGKIGIDTVVQYYVWCDFDGPFSDMSAPKVYTDFPTNPPHYEPIDLNDGKTNTVPYYFVFSCLPGEVWINELNYRRRTDEGTNEYVELCGPAGTDIEDWRIDLVGTDLSVYDFGLITNGTPLQAEDNGFGFLVWGDPLVGAADIHFTNDTSQNIQQNGGVRLVRSMGAYEQLLCYGNDSAVFAMTNSGYEYIGYEDSALRRSSIYLTGTGAVYSAFSWYFPPTGSDNHYTAGYVNRGQQLVGNAPPPVITVTGFWITQTNAWIVFTSDAGLTPTPWYCEDLIQTNWQQVGTSWYTESGGVYTQWFELFTNNPTYHFQIRVDDP
jgi:hypothetical protein